MFTLLGGPWTPYSRGRADSDDEASTESQEPGIRSMELLVQLGEDHITRARVRSFSGKRQSGEGPEWRN